MENRETIHTSISHEAATKILCRALSNLKITNHYTKDPERAELNLENPENGDVMEVLFLRDQIWEIVVTRDTEIVIYGIRED